MLWFLNFRAKNVYFFQAFDWNLRRLDDQYFHRKHFMDTETWMEIRMWNIPMCSKSSAKGCVKNKSWNFCDRSNLSDDACVASQLFLRKFEYFTIIFQSNFAQDFWRHFLFRTIKSVKILEIYKKKCLIWIFAPKYQFQIYVDFLRENSNVGNFRP